MSTSSTYKQKMVAIYRPAMDVEVEYGQIDPDARDNARVTEVSAETVFSNKAQTINDHKKEPTVKVATLEKNSFVLDGSFTLTPEAPPTEYEVGYRPLEMGDANGKVFAVYEVSTVEIHAVGITIMWEPIMEEYAVDFDVIIGNERHEIRGNRKITWESDFEVVGVNKVRIEVFRWSRPFARVKMQQFEFGVYIILGVDELTALSATNRIDLISSSLPESTANLSFQNVGKSYDPMELYGREKFVEERQPITIRAGYRGERYLIGYYELTGTPKITLSEVSIDAKSLVKNLDRDYPTKYYQNVSLGSILREVLEYCQIVNYRIDPCIDNMIVTSLVSDTCRGIVTDIAIATGCVVWQADNTFVVERLTRVNEGYLISDKIAVAPTLQFRSKVQKISCNAVSFSISAEIEEVGSLSVEEAGTYMITLEPCLSPTVTGGTLISHGIDYAEVNVTNVSEDGVSVSGRKILETVSPYEKTQNVKGEERQIEDNTFINTKEVAEAVMNRFLTYYNMRHEFTAEWRQDPSIQVGDIVNLDTDFGRQEIQIEEQNYDLSDGGMKGTTKAVRLGKAV